MQDIELVRNIAFLGHGKSGKTSLAEAILHTSGKTKKLGRVDEGTSVLDFEPEEIEKNHTINNAFHNYTWKKHRVFLIDTPGDDNFINETKFASRVADNAVFVVGAVLGVKYQTQKIAGYIKDNGLPTILCINKMDRERANFEKTISEIKEQLPIEPAVCYLPIGSEDTFKGIIDVINNKAYFFDVEGSCKTGDIPEDMMEAVTSAQEELMEQVAETDDELIEKFLEDGKLNDSDLLQGLAKAVRESNLSPAVPCSAAENCGSELILNAINDFFPSPDQRPAQVGTDPKTEDLVEIAPSTDSPFSALVFKTTEDPFSGKLSIFRTFSGVMRGDSLYNASKDKTEKCSQLYIMEGKELIPVESASPGMITAAAKLKETATGDTLATEKTPVVYEGLDPIQPTMSYSVRAASRDEEDKLFTSLSKILAEDPTLKVERQEQTRETVLSGVGQRHLQIICDRIKRKYKVDLHLSTPKVPYKETIKGTARVQGKHKKQSGGRGQFADSWIEMEPLPRGGGFEFEDHIVGGVIPKQYIPAVEQGIINAAKEGVLAGYPTVDLKVKLVDGSFHPVDSSEMAFQISGSIAFKEGAKQARPTLLEPINNVTIFAPKDCVGDIVGDLNSRRGKVLGMDSEKNSEIIKAQVPMAEILEYTPDLTSITAGRGYFTTEFSHYEEVPAHIMEKITTEGKNKETGQK
ncbi:MAG: elongation factor G [Desulfobia sp.]